MKRFAIVDPAGQRIERAIDVEDEFDVLPIIETEDLLGDDQILGDPAVTIAKDHVSVHRPAVRALSGRIAILNDRNLIEEIRDLGDQRVQVADNVHRLIETNPDFDPTTQQRKGPEIRITKRGVEQVFKITSLTAEEIAARSARLADEELARRFGEQGLRVMFDQENRLRLIEGKNRVSIDEFMAAQRAAP